MPRSSTKSPSYIVRQDHSYCFRMVIPAAFRAMVGRTELRYTLSTGSMYEAKQRARTIATYVLGLYNDFSDCSQKKKYPTPDEFTEMVSLFLEEFRKTWDLRFIQRTIMDDQWRKMLKSIVIKTASKHQIIPEPRSGHFQKTRTPMKTIISEYSSEMITAKKWTDKTKQENIACYKLFLDFVGAGIAVEEITSKLMREFKAGLLRLPTNMDKAPAYKCKSAKEVSLLEHVGQAPKMLGIGTINKHLTRISTLLSYVVTKKCRNSC